MTPADEADAPERAAIIAAYRQLNAQWQPLDLHPFGCLTIIAALLLYGIGVVLIGHFTSALPAWSGTGLTVFAAVVGVAGFLMMQIRVVKESPERRSERAIAALAGGALDAGARRQEAVALLFHAYDFRGPTMSSSYDPVAAKPRLGASLDYVQTVEQVLQGAGLMSYPVFTRPVNAPRD